MTDIEEELSLNYSAVPSTMAEVLHASSTSTTRTSPAAFTSPHMNSMQNLNQPPPMPSIISQSRIPRRQSMYSSKKVASLSAAPSSPGRLNGGSGLVPRSPVANKAVKELVATLGVKPLKLRSVTAAPRGLQHSVTDKSIAGESSTGRSTDNQSMGSEVSSQSIKGAISHHSHKSAENTLASEIHPSMPSPSPMRESGSQSSPKNEAVEALKPVAVEESNSNNSPPQLQSGSTRENEPREQTPEVFGAGALENVTQSKSIANVQQRSTAGESSATFQKLFQPSSNIFPHMTAEGSSPVALEKTLSTMRTMNPADQENQAPMVSTGVMLNVLDIQTSPTGIKDAVSIEIRPPTTRTRGRKAIPPPQIKPASTRLTRQRVRGRDTKSLPHQENGAGSASVMTVPMTLDTMNSTRRGKRTAKATADKSVLSSSTENDSKGLTQTAVASDIMHSVEGEIPVPCQNETLPVISLARDLPDPLDFIVGSEETSANCADPLEAANSQAQESSKSLFSPIQVNASARLNQDSTASKKSSLTLPISAPSPIAINPQATTSTVVPLLQTKSSTSSWKENSKVTDLADQVSFGCLDCVNAVVATRVWKRLQDKANEQVWSSKDGKLAFRNVAGLLQSLINAERHLIASDCSDTQANDLLNRTSGTSYGCSRPRKLRFRTFDLSTVPPPVAGIYGSDVTAVRVLDCLLEYFGLASQMRQDGSRNALEEGVKESVQRAFLHVATDTAAEQSDLLIKVPKAEICRAASFLSKEISAALRWEATEENESVLKKRLCELLSCLIRYNLRLCVNSQYVIRDYPAHHSSAAETSASSFPCSISGQTTEREKATPIGFGFGTGTLQFNIDDIAAVIAIALNDLHVYQPVIDQLLAIVYSKAPGIQSLPEGASRKNPSQQMRTKLRRLNIGVAAATGSLSSSKALDADFARAFQALDITEAGEEALEVLNYIRAHSFIRELLATPLFNQLGDLNAKNQTEAQSPMAQDLTNRISSWSRLQKYANAVVEYDCQDEAFWSPLRDITSLWPQLQKDSDVLQQIYDQLLTLPLPSAPFPEMSATTETSNATIGTRTSLRVQKRENANVQGRLAPAERIVENEKSTRKAARGPGATALPQSFDKRPTLRSMLTLTTLSATTKKKYIVDERFLCAYPSIVSHGQSSSNGLETICPECYEEAENRNQETLCCRNCNRNYHLQCLGLPREFLIKMDSWVCQACYLNERSLSGRR